MKNSIIKLGALGIASMLLSINVDAADVEINFTEYTTARTVFRSFEALSGATHRKRAEKWTAVVLS